MSKITKEQFNEAFKLVDFSLREFEPELKIIHIEGIKGYLRDLAGKVLTIVDASIPQGTQNKCTKDLIKSEYHKLVNNINDWYGVDIHHESQLKSPIPELD